MGQPTMDLEKFDTPEAITLWLMLCAMDAETRATFRRYMASFVPDKDADVREWFGIALDTLNEFEARVLSLEDAVSNISELTDN